MKSSILAILGILLTAFVTVNADGNAEMGEKIKKAFEEVMANCKDKITPENLAQLMKNPESMESNSEAKCFEACALTQVGFMKDGKITTEKIEEITNGFLGDDKKDMAKKIIDGVKSCADEANKNDNECEVAGAFGTCMKKYDVPKFP